MSAIIFAIYFIHYIYQEFHVIPFKYFTVQSVISYLCFLFLFLFIIPYWITKNINLTRKFFVTIPFILAVVFTFKMAKELSKILRDNKSQSKNPIKNHFRTRIIAANFGLISLLMLPIIVFFGDNQAIQHSFTNVGFFVMSYAYIKNHVYKQRLENETLSYLKKSEKEFKRENLLIQYHLTTKEMEIATLILQNHKYKKIADMVYIAEKTVSKHASNIFKKTQVKNKEHFLKNFNNL